MGAHSLAAQWLVPPRLASWQKQILSDIRRRVPRAPLVWVMSSGTQSVNQVKCIGLTREAIESSAYAVNQHLGASRRDHWLIAIPEYHVGGYSIPVRARLSGSKVSRLGKWNARKFVKSIGDERITLCSLVPTQVYDLVQAGGHCPKPLRAIVVGGGPMDPTLYARARASGWPVLPSYGLMETASQVATANLSSLKVRRYPALEVLSHAKLKNRDGCLWVRSTSLCDLVANANTQGEFTLEDPRRDGWLRTEDVAERRARGWQILGRRDDVVKIFGVLVSLPQVECELRDFFHQRGINGGFVVLSRPTPREGRELIMVTDSVTSLQELDVSLMRFNAKVPGPQRLTYWVWTPEIPRTGLGKIMKAALRDRLL